MNPHKLIFEYLDGELNREDDKALRDLLKEDTELSRDFQSILDINYEIQKSNEEYNYPENFLDSVEEGILARMEQDNLLREEKERKRKVFFGYSIAAVPAFILLIVLTTLNFGNLQVDLQKILQNQTNELSLVNDENANQTNQLIQDNSDLVVNKTASYSVKKSAEKSGKNYQMNLITESDETAVETNFAAALDSREFNSIGNSSNSDIESKSVENENPGNNSTTNSVSIPSARNTSPDLVSDSEVNNFSKSKSANEIRIENSQAMILAQTIPNVKLNENLEKSFKKNISDFGTNFTTFSSTVSHQDIVMNSLLGTELVTFGLSNSHETVNSFTQSIGAVLDDYSQFGLETGYMEIRGDEGIYNLIKADEELNTLVLNNSTSSNSELTRIPNTQEANKKLFWAGLFYQRELLELNSLSLSSRISFGASDYGIVSSLKIMGSYEISRNFEFTLGADTKIYSGIKDLFVTQNNLSSTISLIYGIHFAF
ncbi:MAG: hypothetical protein A2X64_03525 [Ignavibacteria bacterium GWF2_33_9]|nr:MAG: hypothetical protein A2X64_03525 [Ignavibacteria bacterium GWF2_33_9]